MDADRIAGDTLNIKPYELATLGVPPNLAAALATIRSCEGTSDVNGYRALFGYGAVAGRLFDSFAAHPNQRFVFKQTDGTMATTSAAGAYQFEFATWEGLRVKLGLADFSPISQDLGAIELFRQRNAYDDAVAGRLQAWIDKCSTVWASLPASRYAQPKRSIAFATDAYLNSGGVLA